MVEPSASARCLSPVLEDVGVWLQCTPMAASRLGCTSGLLAMRLRLSSCHVAFLPSCFHADYAKASAARKVMVAALTQQLELLKGGSGGGGNGGGANGGGDGDSVMARLLGMTDEHGKPLTHKALMASPRQPLVQQLGHLGGLRLVFFPTHTHAHTHTRTHAHIPPFDLLWADICNPTPTHPPHTGPGHQSVVRGPRDHRHVHCAPDAGKGVRACVCACKGGC